VGKLWIAAVNGGWVGVQLFFVLSGFLITRILLDARGTEHPLRDFYVRRALRIVPIYFVLLVAAFALVPLFLPALAVSPGMQAPYWLFLSNWSQAIAPDSAVRGLTHLWSLAVEEQFYLLWPALALGLKPRAFAKACLLLVAVAIGARLAMLAAGLHPDWPYQATLGRLDALALGGLVAVASRNAEGRALYARLRLPLTAAALVAFLVMVALTRSVSAQDWWMQTAGYTLLAVIFATLIAEAAVAEPRGWRAWLAQPHLRLVGKYSYAIYLFHLPVQLGLERFVGKRIDALYAASPLLEAVVYTGATFAISFALAAVSYRLVERPFLRMKERIAS
jgi:peptidoglycan/LPS O-acetylase OafA/YrhL